MQGLTARQAQILDLIRRHINETGYPPTRADIASELGFKSPNAAEEHLKALARKGAIEMVPGTSRGIRLPEPGGLPIVGRVAAGSPILAQEHIEESCELPGNFFISEVLHKRWWPLTTELTRAAPLASSIEQRAHRGVE